MKIVRMKAYKIEMEAKIIVKIEERMKWIELKRNAKQR